MTDLTEIAREIDINDCYQQEMIDMREDIFGDKTIPVQVVESLRKVIDYLYEDECEDCYNTLHQNEYIHNHIFLDIRRLDEWVQMLIDSNTH